MTINSEDKRRIIEHIDRGFDVGGSIENIFQRIAEGMPHVTDADIREVAAVYAEEGRRAASELMAQPQGAKQIAQIIEQTENSVANDPKSIVEKGRRMIPPQFPIEQTWKEMDEYLARNRAMGPPKTVEEQAQRNAEFWAIEERRIEHRNRVLAAEALATHKRDR